MDMFGALPKNDLEHLCTSYLQKFSELKEVNFIVVGANGFLGKWLATYLTFLQVNTLFKGTLTFIVRNPNKLAELDSIPYSSYRKIITPNSLGKSKISNLRNIPTIIIYAATSTVTHGKKVGEGDTFSSELPDKIIKAINSDQIIFVHLSSGGVYLPTSRELIAIPSDYAVQAVSDDLYINEKLKLEQWTESHYIQDKFLIRNPRLFAFYGPNLQMNRHFAISEFMHQGIKGLPIIVKGNPNNLRSYLYPTDAINQIFGQCLVEDPPYNQIGSANAMTISKAAQIVADEYEVPMEVLDANSLDINNYVPMDVPISSGREFTSGISQWRRWLEISNT